jgi:hypothetical protein
MIPQEEIVYKNKSETEINGVVGCETKTVVQWSSLDSSIANNETKQKVFHDYLDAVTTGNQRDFMKFRIKNGMEAQERDLMAELRKQTREEYGDLATIEFEPGGYEVVEATVSWVAPPKKQVCECGDPNSLSKWCLPGQQNLTDDMVILPDLPEGHALLGGPQRSEPSYSSGGGLVANVAENLTGSPWTVFWMGLDEYEKAKTNPSSSSAPKSSKAPGYWPDGTFSNWKWKEESQTKTIIKKEKYEAGKYIINDVKPSENEKPNSIVKYQIKPTHVDFYVVLKTGEKIAIDLSKLEFSVAEELVYKSTQFLQSDAFTKQWLDRQHAATQVEVTPKIALEVTKTYYTIEVNPSDDPYLA